jgi:flagellar motor switch/type III secretory pathway protein FliN
MDAPMTVRPFPWASLASIGRGELDAARGAARMAGGASVLDAFAAELERSLRASCTARIAGVSRTATAPREDDLAIAIDISGSPIAIEVEAALAADVVARILGRTPPPIATTARDAVAIAGAFAAVVVRALRRAREDADVVVRDAGHAPQILAATAIADPSAVDLTLTLDRDAYRVRVVFSKRLAAAAAPARDRQAFNRLNTLLLEVPIIGALAWTPARELQRLGSGDVWIPGTLGRANARRTVVLAGARASHGLSATLEPSGRLVLGHSVEDLTMSENAQDTIVESALDAPVVVRVEVGVVALTAREWAELKPGDVITTGTRVGESVLLRAGGAELARGELVEIEGEVGVRITKLAGGGS